MYLDGQLPGGPPSSNQGGRVNPDGVSALDGTGDDVVVSPKPGDLSGSTFFVVEGGGPVVVSPSLATSDGIVQYPINSQQSARRGDNKPCPDYGSDGSLVTLRNDAGRQGGLSGMCQSGYQSFQDLTIPEKPSVLPWLVGLAGLALLTSSSKGARR